ncbi:hypothetical protein Clacol_001746 [Clathrus columnatus]|uniref:Uncharacterized protein n=1 Tax=Clathrus columnatus TaxID=1419009 RepID=A0AAV4ZYY2_9AGAM|nr:hypothetical protein Clacol_001746 [Clathrus columnatus]
MLHRNRNNNYIKSNLGHTSDTSHTINESKQFTVSRESNQKAGDLTDNQIHFAKGRFLGILERPRASLNPRYKPYPTVFEQLKNVVIRARTAKLRAAPGAPSVAILSDMDFFWLGALSKLVATALTYPYIVVKSRLQADSAQSRSYASSLDGLRKIMQEEGLHGLYKGVGSKLVQSVLTAAILFAGQRRIYEIVYAATKPVSSVNACPSTCPTTTCIPLPSQNSGGSGTSPGALAGAIIGALIVLTLVIVGYIFYRRHEARKEATVRDKALADVKPDIPARADAVLSRPDPHHRLQTSSIHSGEKPSQNETELGTVRVYNNETNINLDPTQDAQSTRTSARSNPFTDGDDASIQTASERSQSTNVIPIALVPPGSQTSSNSKLQEQHQSASIGVDRGLHAGYSLGKVKAPYASSARSGVSAKSFMTTSSVASFDEQPTIMTPKQGVVRQVLEVTQAQVVRVPSTGSSAKGRGTRNLARSASKSTVGKSPLNKSFTPTDIPLVPTSPASAGHSLANPFNDPIDEEAHRYSSRTTDTFGRPYKYDEQGSYSTQQPINTNQSHRLSYDDSYSVKADIVVAERAVINMRSASVQSGPLSPGLTHSRATSMRTSGGRTDVSLERDYDDRSIRPNSILSSKTTSSHADSVLAKFPFVPPSPISSLPSRSPVSPAVGGSTFARQQVETAPRSIMYTSNLQPPQSPLSTVTTHGSLRGDSDTLPIPVGPGRSVSTLTSSTGSGLGSYPFQFENSDDPLTPSMSRGSQRASLDTLALTKDLAAFPFPYEPHHPGEQHRQT